MKHSLKQNVGVFLVSVTVGGAANAANPSYDRYKSWLVACDNGLTCEAKGFANDIISRPDLRFIRTAGPDATIEVAVNVPFPVDLGDFRVDGKPLHFGSSWKLSRDEDLTTISAKDPVAVKELLSSLRNDSQIEVGDDKLAIPLDGMIAALLHIDDRQGRVDGVTALIKTGGARLERSGGACPAGRHPPQDRCHVIGWGGTAPDRAGKDFQQTSFRERRMRSRGIERRPSRRSISPQRRSRPCLHSLHHGRLSRIVTCIHPAASGRGRIVTDCGLSAEWAWNGADFQLAGVSYQPDCGGIQLGDWPTLFRTR